MTFVEPVLPLPRLVIAGAGHVGKAVARLGRLLDFSVTVIDDRPEFANSANVPDADEIVVGDIGEAVRDDRGFAGQLFRHRHAGPSEGRRGPEGRDRPRRRPTSA